LFFPVQGRISSERSSFFGFLKGVEFSTVENEIWTPWWDINESEVSYTRNHFTLKSAVLKFYLKFFPEEKMYVTGELNKKLVLFRTDVCKKTC
jgi:hypothetical protein